MTDSVWQLYPLPSQALSLSGLYLAHNLRQVSQRMGPPFLYGNFVTSLDGRIAIPHPTKPGMMVPPQIANDRDWRLFQELAIQADLVISSGRYLRDYADGRAQEILRVYDDPQFADLVEWRLTQGLPPQPDLAVISASLDFPIPDVLTTGERKVIIFTTEQADSARVKALEAQTGHVTVVGAQSVDGVQLTTAIAELGYQTVYSAAGPRIMHLLLAAGVLDRLYLTHAQRLLGGDPYASIVEGDLLEPSVGLTLNTLYYDPHGLDGVGQIFASYNRQSE